MPFVCVMCCAIPESDVSGAGTAAAAQQESGSIAESSAETSEPPPVPYTSPCDYPEYVSRHGLVLILVMEEPWKYALVPAKPSEQVVLYSTGALGYAPSQASVLPGEEVRVYQCNGHAWGYLGNLNTAAFNAHGGQVDHLSVTNPNGQLESVPWSATGYLVRPKKQ